MRFSGWIAKDAATSLGFCRLFILLSIDGRAADAGVDTGEEEDDGGAEEGGVSAGDIAMGRWKSRLLLDEA